MRLSFDTFTIKRRVHAIIHCRRCYGTCVSFAICHSANVHHRVIRHGINYVTTDIVLFFKRRIRMRRNKNESERVKKTKQKQTNFERPFTTEITEDMHHSKEYTSLCVVSLYVALHCRHSVPSAGHSCCSSQTVDVTQKKRSI